MVGLKGGMLQFLVLLLVAVVVSDFSFAASEAHNLIINPQRCSPLSVAQQKWLAPAWRPYLKYTRSCEVRNSKNKAVVVLVSVHAFLYYKAQPGNQVYQIKLPDPIVFLPTGEAVGSLPYNFPDDPPAELRVTFTNWHQDFPERIELYLTDPRAGGDRALLSVNWSKDKKKYLRQGE